MPGFHLSNNEQKHQDWWENSKVFSYPVLRELIVDSRPGVRGIHSIQLKFETPIVAVTGHLGAGKSSILKLCALAYKAPDGAATYTPRTFASHCLPAVHLFDNLFGPETLSTVSDTLLTWKYSGRTSFEIESTPSNIPHTELPSRPVFIISLSRTISEKEEGVVKHDYSTCTAPELEALNQQSISILSEIVERSYKKVSSKLTDDYEIFSCETDSTYTVFGMSIGERSVIRLLQVLEKCPNGSLLLIDDIETGLHPSAINHLLRHLVETAVKQKLQVILTTRSEYVLDALPRKSRLLLEHGGSHTLTTGLSTRGILSSLSGNPHPELIIYCEDEVAEKLLSNSFPADIRRRVQVVPCGAASKLLSFAAYHLHSRRPERAFILWDGDMRNEEVNNFRNSGLTGEEKQQLNWGYLPGDIAPEKWILDTLDREEGCQLPRHKWLGLVTNHAKRT